MKKKRSKKLIRDPLEDRFRNGRSATMKDTLWQKKHSNRKNLVGKKWYDFYEI